MSKWRHLFVDGEFIARSRLLSGLTLAQATARPPGAPHSIYDELWHATQWQSAVVRRDAAAAAMCETEGQQFPSAAPENENLWNELVAAFLEGAEQAVAWGRSPEELAKEVSPGLTFADVLESLAVHNAYHLGKVAALRQAIGAWPPETK
ncbi:MAG: DinB family protein [Candidatus Eisenbacteria bacterium]|nr:DinB family protein [Candidatus Eisenbacteria bacterium]